MLFVTSEFFVGIVFIVTNNSKHNINDENGNEIGKEKIKKSFKTKKELKHFFVIFKWEWKEFTNILSTFL